MSRARLDSTSASTHGVDLPGQGPSIWRHPPLKVSTSSFTFSTTITSAITQAIAPSQRGATSADRKSTRLNSSHSQISYAVFCLKKKNRHRDSVVRLLFN